MKYNNAIEQSVNSEVFKWLQIFKYSITFLLLQRRMFFFWKIFLFNLFIHADVFLTVYICYHADIIIYCLYIIFLLDNFMYVRVFDFLSQDIFYVRQIINLLINFEFNNRFLININNSFKRLFIFFVNVF